ncbi:hypothetical protein F5Y15DRAFT_398164 [Xylariaceae sp. FL0016]|nr:hypothetical protein F5Y15DRAFT_398164 [Xylariaceae sp. FL0016]
MAEQVIDSSQPRADAVAWITDNGRRAWTFHDWVTAMKYPGLKAGIRGGIAAGGGEINFTIRFDWDENKGYHVNAMRGNERRAYCQSPRMQVIDSENAAVQRYQVLTDDAEKMGEATAVGKFMAINQYEYVTGS